MYQTTIDDILQELSPDQRRAILDIIRRPQC
jgi:hypothetical protein